jgi:hypothetical protein
MVPVGDFVTAQATDPYGNQSLFSNAVQAAAPVLMVNTTADSGAGSLRDAVIHADTDAAKGLSDVIKFDPSLSGATILLTSGQLELSGSGSITIDGSSLAIPVTISGNNASRVFQVDFGLRAELDSLTIAAGNASTGSGGGGIANSGTLSVTGCALIANSTSSGSGGGIYNIGTLTLDSSSLTGNRALSNSTFAYGGGIWNGGTGTTSVTNCTLANNIAFASFASYTFSGSALAYGGGIWNGGTGTISVTNCILAGNVARASFIIGSWAGSALAYGGGIYDEGTKLTLSGCTLSGNWARADASSNVGNSAAFSDGGAIYSKGAQLTVRGCTLYGNSAYASANWGNDYAYSYGGGIYNWGQQTTISGCTLSNNTASSHSLGYYTAYSSGGAIYNAGTLKPGSIATASFGNTTQLGTQQPVADNGSFPTTDTGSTVTGLVPSIDPSSGRIVYKVQVLPTAGNSAPSGVVTLTYGNKSLQQGVNGPPVTFTSPAITSVETAINAAYFDPFGFDDPSTSAPLIPAVTARTPADLQALLSSVASSPTTAVAVNIDPTMEAAAISAVNSLTGSGTVVLDLNPGKYTAATLSPAKGITLIINGVVINTIIDPGTPALTVTSGNVVVEGLTFTETGDAPAILVTGGDLVLRDSTVLGSTSYSDPAIAVSGGSTVDLGTPDSPGGNTITVTAPPIQSTGTNFITAAGDTVQVNGATVSVVANVALASSANPSLLNQAVTFTATVSAQNAGSAAPTGNVTFIDQTTGSTLAVVALSGGSATWSASGLAVNAHTIVAVYSGDSSYITSTTSLAQQVRYRFSGFAAPLSSNLAFGLNRTIPVKFQLTDYNGVSISSLSAIQSLQVLDASGTNVLTNIGGTALRYDSTAKQFIANWNTKGLSAGTYTVTLVLADGAIYTKQVQLSGNGSNAALLVDGSSPATTAVGALLGGDIDLYVDNSSSDLTTDELARIQDAVTAVDAVTQPYGVAVIEVSDPTLADVTLNMDTASAVGGFADGVLGCTTDAGQITIISSWNFYTGSDATKIGSAQYDFQTVVTHELGHALGLGHSADNTSVMYAMLNTGTVNRSLTTADLNVQDSDTTGACGLHAAMSPLASIPILQFGLGLDALSMPGPVNVGLYLGMTTGPANSFWPVPLNDEVVSNILPASTSPIVSSRDAVDEVFRQWGKDATCFDGADLNTASAWQHTQASGLPSSTRSAPAAEHSLEVSPFEEL